MSILWVLEDGAGAVVEGIEAMYLGGLHGTEDDCAVRLSRGSKVEISSWSGLGAAMQGRSP